MAVLAASAPPSLFGIALLRDGHGPRSQALAGIGTPVSGEAFAAAQWNPAGWAGIRERRADFSLSAAYFDASFSNAANDDAGLDRGFGALPDVALAVPVENRRVTLGFSVTPDVALQTDYDLVDAPGSAGGVSYGRQRYATRFAAVRAALNAGWRASDRLSLGASVGAVFDENRLAAPYTFQSPHALQGVKTLVDLRTRGVGPSARFGLLYRISEDIRFGLSYRAQTTLQTGGEANGDASASFAALGLSGSPRWAYDVDIETEIPRMASAGLAWQATPRWGVLVQADWINYADTYENLTLELSDGDNATLNGLVGGDAFVERAPLRWDDQWVFRLGTRYRATDGVTLRAGYAYGDNPVPAGTATPLTAAIQEETLGAGADWSAGQWDLSLAYQYAFPSEVRVNDSDLVGGEFDNSSFEIEGHWLSVRVGRAW